MTLKDAVQILQISPPITRGQLTKAYVDALAEWHPDRVAQDAALAAEADGRLRLIAEAHGMLNALPESGYPFNVSYGQPRPPSASGIMRPFQAPKIAVEAPRVVAARQKVSPLAVAAYVVVGVAVVGLAGVWMHVQKSAAPARPEASGEALASSSEPAPQPVPALEPVAPMVAPKSRPPMAQVQPSTPAGTPADEPRTFAELQARALEGDAQAQWLTAQAYEKGEGVQANPEEALKWALMAAEQAVPMAQMKVGMGYKEGVVVAKDLAEALRWFERASAAGVEQGGYEAALCLLLGGKGAQDHARAVALLRPLAEKGVPAAQQGLGMCYRHGKGVAADVNEALKWLFPAAKKGQVLAQLELGLIYTERAKIPEDLEEAAKWYREAADQQDPEAQHLLAQAYADGKGVAKDPATAFKWWSLAANQDYADAQDSLGLAYQRGIGVAENMEKAVHWFNRAAEHDHAGAKFHLSVCHVLGVGVPEDKVRAAAYCLEAADLGYAPAQNNMGVFYMEGTGVRQDPSEAYKWFTLASSQGHGSSTEWLAKLKPTMTAFQIAEGERRVRAFAPRELAQVRPADDLARAPEPAPAAQQPSMEHLVNDNRLPSGTLLTDRFREFGGQGRLIVDNGLVDDAYVKVVGGRKLWASFYVRGGEKFALDHVPDGTYQVLYCTGFDWNAKAHDFGRNQHAMRHDRSLDFTTTRATEGTQTTISASVLTLTLHQVSGGNAPTSDISLEEFNKF